MSEMEKTDAEIVSRNFIEQIIDKDLAEGACETVHTSGRKCWWTGTAYRR